MSLRLSVWQNRILPLENIRSVACDCKCRSTGDVVADGRMQVYSIYWVQSEEIEEPYQWRRHRQRPHTHAQCTGTPSTIDHLLDFGVPNVSHSPNCCIAWRFRQMVSMQSDYIHNWAVKTLIFSHATENSIIYFFSGWSPLMPLDVVVVVVYCHFLFSIFTPQITIKNKQTPYVKRVRKTFNRIPCAQLFAHWFASFAVWMLFFFNRSLHAVRSFCVVVVLRSPDIPVFIWFSLSNIECDRLDRSVWYAFRFTSMYRIRNNKYSRRWSCKDAQQQHTNESLAVSASAYALQWHFKFVMECPINVSNGKVFVSDSNVVTATVWCIRIPRQKERRT